MLLMFCRKNRRLLCEAQIHIYTHIMAREKENRNKISYYIFKS